jgi:radical SAM superfamily enzyme YgiQ (UPF0313 family)
MSIKFEVITEFAEIWREEVKMPFYVSGLIPNYVREDKIEVLTWAGLDHVRMGIQSGSQRILDFYRRPTPVCKIEEAVQTLHKFRKYHLSPEFDIIVDNPIETRKDVIDTLELLYRLPRPYFLLVYSLRIIPNTELARLFKEQGIDAAKIDQFYNVLTPSFSNLLIYMLTFYKPPRKLFKRLLQNVHAFGEEQKHYPKLAFCLRLLYIARRGFACLQHMDVSVLPGWIGYLFWKLGIIAFWRKCFLPKRNNLQLTEKQSCEQ